MKHILFLYYILAMISGISVFTGSVLLYNIYRIKELRHFLVFFLFFSFSIFSMTMGFYLSVFSEHTMLIPKLGSCLILFFFPQFLHHFYDISQHRTKYFVWLSVFVGFSVILSTISTTPSIITTCFYLFSLAHIGNILYCLSLARFKDLDPLKKKFTIYVVGITLLFIPGFLYDINHHFLTFIKSSLHFDFTTGYYITLNIILLYHAWPYAQIKQGKLDEQLLKDILTQREVEVALLVYRGYTNEKIAKELFISLSTVKKHLQNLFEKAGVSNRVQLTRWLKNPTKG